MTKLHNDVSLEGEWEVGLVDIMYPRNWYNIENQYLVISCAECRSTDLLFKPDENAPTYYEIGVRIPSGFYETATELVGTLNASIRKAYRDPVRAQNSQIRYVNESQWPKIVLNNRTRCIDINMPADMTITFSEKLSAILGMEELVVYEPFYNGERPHDIDGGLHALYVYCDVLECVSVGDTMAPLLRIVEVKGPSGEMTHIQYDQPRYIPLQKKAFDSIEIDIRDDTGKPIPFDSGKLIVTLHFRRAKDSYFLG